jgi:hypothetical protein
MAVALPDDQIEGSVVQGSTIDVKPDTGEALAPGNCSANAERAQLFVLLGEVVVQLVWNDPANDEAEKAGQLDNLRMRRDRFTAVVLRQS